MDSPADRFTQVPEQERDVLGLRVPGVLALVPQQRTAPPVVPDPAEVAPVPVGPPKVVPAVVPVEFERVVPASGNLQVAGERVLAGAGPLRADTVTFWADTSVIHLLIAGARIKTVRSHLSVAGLGRLAGRGGRAAGWPRFPPTTGPRSRWTRSRTTAAWWAWADARCWPRRSWAAARWASASTKRRCRSSIRPHRELLRVRPNPLSGEEVRTQLPGPVARPDRHRVRASTSAGAAADQHNGRRSWYAAGRLARPDVCRTDRDRTRVGLHDHRRPGRPGPGDPAHDRHPCSNIKQTSPTGPAYVV